MDVEARREFWATMREFAARGKTVVFATHYLEEADAYADRIILMAHGRVVADGPATEIKATVGLRTIRATLPGADLAALGRAARRDERRDRAATAVILNCSDSDAALRALLPAYPAARDIEVTGAGLEEAFLQLTGDDRRRPTDRGRAPMSTATYTRFELLRTLRNRQRFIFSLAFPIVMYFLLAGAEQERPQLRRRRGITPACSRRSTTWSGCSRFGAMVAVLVRRRAHRRRAHGRLEPAAAADAAVARARTSRTKVADRLPDGRARASCCSTSPASSLGVRLPFARLAAR